MTGSILFEGFVLHPYTIIFLSPNVNNKVAVFNVKRITILHNIVVELFKVTTLR